MKRHLSILITIPAITLTLAACSNSDTNSDKTETLTSKSSVAEQPLPETAIDSLEKRGLVLEKGTILPSKLSAKEEVNSDTGLRYTDPRSVRDKPGSLANIFSDPEASFPADCDGKKTNTRNPNSLKTDCSTSSRYDISQINWIVLRDQVSFGIGYKEECNEACKNDEETPKKVLATVTLVEPVNGVFTGAIIDEGAHGVTERNFGK